MRAVTQTHFIEEQIMVQRETSLKEGKKSLLLLAWQEMMAILTKNVLVRVQGSEQI